MAQPVFGLLASVTGFGVASLVGVLLVIFGMALLAFAHYSRDGTAASETANYLERERRLRRQRDIALQSLGLILLGAVLVLGAPTFEAASKLPAPTPTPTSSPTQTPTSSPTPTPTPSPTPGEGTETPSPAPGG